MNVTRFNQPLDNWKVGGTTNVSNMFHGATLQLQSIAVYAPWYQDRPQRAQAPSNPLKAFVRFSHC